MEARGRTTYNYTQAATLPCQTQQKGDASLRIGHDLLVKICPACSQEYDNEHESCPQDGVPLVHLDTGTTDRAQDLIGQVVDGRYRVERIVGRGGMGTVYACRHVVVGKAFAMKVLRSGIERSEEILQRFIREAQAANAVHSRHICEMTDFGQLPNGAFYIIMELLQGMSFTRALRENRLQRKDIKDIFIQIAETLDQTHRANIIHRDLKPDNVVLENKHTGGYFVKLVDFGIAKILETNASNLTETGVILGTPYYMSPEQARGDPLDARSDIYALGVMMYRAFAGRLPFVADTAMGVLTRHLTQKPELPSRLADMELTLERLILRCLEKKPVDRFQSMADVADALRTIADEVVRPRNHPTIDERSGALAAPQLLGAAAGEAAPISMATPTKVATPLARDGRRAGNNGGGSGGPGAAASPDGGSNEHPSVIPPPLPTPGVVTPADASGQVPAAGTAQRMPVTTGPQQPSLGPMASGDMPLPGSGTSGAHGPPQGLAGPAVDASSVHSSGALPQAMTGNAPASTADLLPIHLQGEAPTNRGVVSSRISTRSLSGGRGRSALWVGVAVLMAGLGGAAAYAMFWPPAPVAPGSAIPSTVPSATATEDASAEELIEAPWANADPVEAPPSAEPSAKPAASTSTGTAPPKVTTQPPPPPDPKEDDEPPAEIRSPFD